MEHGKKIRVLEAIRQGKVGGGESHVLDLVEHLDTSRFESIVLAFTHGKMIDRLEQMGIKNHVIPCETALSPLTWYKVYKLMVREKIDLIHVHGTRANIHIIWAAKWLRIPVIYSVHGWSFHDDQSGIIRRLRILFERLVTKAVNQTISVSYSNQQTGYTHIPHFTSEVIPYGIDLQYFHPGRPFKDLRREWGISPDAIVIGFVARMTVQKDPVTLLHAFKTVSSLHPKAILLMVGEGELKKETVRLTEELGLTDKVVFEKFRADVPDVLHAMDIFCLPSLWEGLPIGLLEAMAMQKPAVVTGVDGSREMIVDGENGCLVSPRHPGELAAALDRLVSDKGLRVQVGSAARETVEDTFEVGKMTRHIEELYLKVLYAGRKSPAVVKGAVQMKYSHLK